MSAAALNMRRNIVEAMGTKPMALDDIADRAGYSPDATRRHLLAMETAGVVARADMMGIADAGWVVANLPGSASPIVTWLEERGLWTLARDAAMGAHATVEEVCTRDRSRRVSHARQAVWSALEMKGLSRLEIARAFRRDHTTVGYGIGQADKRQVDAADGQATGPTNRRKALPPSPIRETYRTEARRHVSAPEERSNE